MSETVCVYRYRRIDDVDQGRDVDADGQHRYATKMWIDANRNVRLIPNTERRISARDVDLNGMCFLPDLDEEALPSDLSQPK